MDTALPQKFPFILDRNLVKANCTENRVCTSCDIVVLGCDLNFISCQGVAQRLPRGLNGANKLSKTMLKKARTKYYIYLYKII